MDPVNNQENNPVPETQVPEQLSPQEPVPASGGQNNQNPILPKKWLLIGSGILVIVAVSAAALFLAPKTSEKKPESKKEQVVKPSATPFPTLAADMQKAVDEAAQAAKAYDDGQAAVLTEYPWIRKLPLAKPTYYVYFDLDKKVFVGRLYPKPGDNVEQMKRLIQQELKISKGIPIENYTFEWTVNPK